MWVFIFFKFCKVCHPEWIRSKRYSGSTGRYFTFVFSLTPCSICGHHVATFYMKKSHYFSTYWIFFITLVREGALRTSRRRISCFSMFFYCKNFTTEGCQDNVTTRLHSGRSGARIAAGARDCFSSRKCPYRPWAQLVSCSLWTVGFFPGVRRPRREAEHSPPFVAEV